ncbi:response regulator transcription factor [Egibacter rhizosphaerae]|uniref:Response regulator transcription factor n=1 Tax=Egibacter rhizosphaerae TaxID=1670831 RepID=A0A411YHY2_9ACTN|nr:response regulator transcription factor [Egibacter rhizosphaerae]QBI20726.1 response regulator transcription factor [Egibacter rhizosphaerae]
MGTADTAEPRQTPVTVGLLDDHEFFRRGVRPALEEPGEPALRVTVDAGDIESFNRACARLGDPTVVLCDLYLSRETGARPHLPVISSLSARGCRVVVISAGGEPADVYRALREHGAMSYVVKDMKAHELVEVVRGVAAGRRPIPPELADTLLQYAPLTRRQHEVLTLIAEGLTYRELAEVLNLTTHTVETHVQNICDRLGVSGRRDLTRLAYQHHLLAPPDDAVGR